MMDIKDQLWIVSNFNQDPTEIIESLKSPYLIFNQGDPDCVPEEYRNESIFKQTFHSGHNISDYLQFIIENYDSLPESLGLIKGNIFPRHISKKHFLKRMNQQGFVPLYSDDETLKANYHRLWKTKLVSQQVASGYYLEIANNWYCKKRCVGKKFAKLDQFLLHFFNRRSPKYISFVPGACMIVPAYKIRRWPLDLYKEMYEAVTYEFFPVEAFHAERSMLYLFDFPSE